MIFWCSFWLLQYCLLWWRCPGDLKQLKSSYSANENFQHLKLPLLHYRLNQPFLVKFVGISSSIFFLNIWSFSAGMFTCYVIGKCVRFACFALNTACSQWLVLFGQTCRDGFLFAVEVLPVTPRVSCARPVSRCTDLCSSFPAYRFFLVMYCEATFHSTI